MFFLFFFLEILSERYYLQVLFLTLAINDVGAELAVGESRTMRAPKTIATLRATTTIQGARNTEREDIIFYRNDTIEFSYDLLFHEPR